MNSKSSLKKSHAHSGFFGMYVACGWVWKKAISFGYGEKVIPRPVDRGLRPRTIFSAKFPSNFSAPPFLFAQNMIQSYQERSAKG